MRKEKKFYYSPHNINKLFNLIIALEYVLKKAEKIRKEIASTKLKARIDKKELAELDK